MILSEKRIQIFCGHYGSGKSNLSVNAALSLAAKGKRTILMDLDIVNPYFRSVDAAPALLEAGVEVVASPYANSNVELPAMPEGVLRAFTGGDAVTVMDVGGDDAGAIALGRYRRHFENSPYAFFYVINQRRLLTSHPREAVEFLREIEAASRLRATGIINNTNLGTETTAETVLRSLPYAEEVSQLCGLPLLCTAARRDVARELEGRVTDLFPIDIHTKQLF